MNFNLLKPLNKTQYVSIFGMYILPFWPTVDVYKVVEGRAGVRSIVGRVGWEGKGRGMME
jgi:hypothetical protein